MKVKFMYKGDKQWTAGSYDLELILYQGSMFPTRLFPIENLQDLGYLIEQNKTIFVLREPMEGLDDGVEYTSIEYNIDVLINSSALFMVEQVSEEGEESAVETPPSEDALQRLDKYLNEEEKEKRLKKMAHIGKPR